MLLLEKILSLKKGKKINSFPFLFCQQKSNFKGSHFSQVKCFFRIYLEWKIEGGKKSLIDFIHIFNKIFCLFEELISVVSLKNGHEAEGKPE